MMVWVLQPTRTSTRRGGIAAQLGAVVSQIEMVCGVPVAGEPLALAGSGAYAQNGIS
jgi:hypothetical protein